MAYGHPAPTAAGWAPLPPPAWYPDPSGAAEWRYWNGQAWTTHVAVAGQTLVRAMPPPLPPAARPETQPRLPARAAVIALVGFVGGIAASIGLSLAGRALGVPRIWRLIAGQAGLWTGLLGACWVVSRRFGTGRVARDFGLRVGWSDVGWGLLMSLAARMAVSVAVAPLLLGSRRLAGTNDKVFRVFRPETASFVVVAVLAVVGAPIVEELFFRGVIQGAFLDRLGTVGAVGLQAVLFGLAHVNPILGLANVTVVVGVAAAGVVFGLTVRLCRLGSSVFAHAFFNLVAVVAVAALATV
jgi:membrane protease YdiL (CAAX protease family)